MTELLKTKKVCRLKRQLQQVAKGLCAFPLFSFLFISCIDEGTNNTGDKGVPLSVGGVTLTLNKTRDISPLTSGSIGIFLSGTNYPTAKKNVQYTYSSSSGWSSSNPIYLNKNSADICAYSPYSASITSSSAVTLTSQLYNTNADLSYAITQTKTSASPSIDFTMVRAYSMLTFHITHDASYTGSCSINNVSISSALSQINSGGSLNIGTGAYTYTAGTVNVPVSGVTIASGVTQDIAVLMVPVKSSITGALTLTFQVDGVTKTGTLSAGTLTALAAGSNYTINVTIKANTFTVSLASKGSGNVSMCAEPANCYIMAPGSSITIPVNIMGNGTLVANSGITSASIATSSVGLLWQTSSANMSSTDVISSIGSVSNGMVTITAGNTSGNAVVKALASDGTTILWSWHIWVTTYNPNDSSNGTTYTLANSATSNVFMDRNLGALGTDYSNDAHILHYQWGRKDPFSAGTVYGRTVDITTSSTQAVSWSVLNPFKFVMYAGDWCSTQLDALWGGASTTTPTAKTMFDPCPAGWRVPAFRSAKSPWEYLASTFFTLGYGGTFSYGWAFTLNGVGIGFYPAAGNRSGRVGTVTIAGSPGYYWSASPMSSSYGYSLNFSSSSVNPTKDLYRSYGLTIRCVQEW